MNLATALAVVEYRARLHGPNLEAWAGCEAERVLLRERYDYVRAWVREELDAVHAARKAHPFAKVSDAKREEVTRAIGLEDRIFRFL